MYVDDIILTGNNPSMIRLFISTLHFEFAIKDLGKLNYFLGLEVTYTSSGLFLSRAKYAKDILLKANLLDSKPVSIPWLPAMTSPMLVLLSRILLYIVLWLVLCSI